MDSRDELKEEKETALVKKKYENVPKYCGRIGGVAGGGVGYVGASSLSAIAHHISSSGYIPSKRAGIAGALIVGSIGYAAGFFAGKVANYAHVPEGIEKGLKQGLKQIKKL